MKDTLNILTIGNSFADSAARALPPVVRSAGAKLNLQKANFGGCELRRHWSYMAAELANPADCRIYPHRPLNCTLRETPWDIVTIQQASHESWRSETFQPYAQNIVNFVREYAPDAEIVIQQTWAYRADHPQFKAGSEWGISQSEMYNRLTVNYKRLSGELGNLRIIPTGYAVQLARKLQSVSFVPMSDEEQSRLVHPDLPPQAGSLVGRHYYLKNEDTQEFELKADLIHLNSRGEYLQAMVWFGMLYEADVTKLDYVSEDIGAADAAFLRSIAKMAIEKAGDIPENC